MSKRASLKISTTTVMELVLVAMAFLVLLGIYGAIMDMFQGRELEASYRNFDTLIDTIHDMDPGEEKTTSFYIPEDMFIIGFGEYDKFIAKDQCGLGADDHITRPTVCGSKPCLCLCSEDDFCTRNDAYCSTDFEEGIGLRGDGSCNYLVLLGNDKPDTITILKTENYVKLCAGVCS